MSTTHGGMVVASHPLAIEAGLAVLRDGGSAVDAAVAASAVLAVVDPRSTSLAGDLFALCWEPGEQEPVGLAAAGPAPDGMTAETLRSSGHAEMPADGPWTVTVPGAPWGWSRLLERFGRLGPERVLAPAIKAARDGYVVTPVVAEEWRRGEEKLRRYGVVDDAFLPGGGVPNRGDRLRNADLAQTLELFVAEGHEPFYRGPLASAMAAAVKKLGGPLAAEDLAAWSGPTWVRPIRSSFRGVDVFEMPPPGQGIVVLEAMRIYESLDATSWSEADHLLVESLKVAFDDASDVVADPDFETVPVDVLLSDAHRDAVAARVTGQAAGSRAPGQASDTVYVAVVDGSGSACSLIQSLYEGFGSGILVEGTGLMLHNRGNGFTLRDGHPNRPEGGKRPYHTIIPAMLGDGGRFLGCLGIVGGFMQPQGQLQILRNLIDRGMSPQEAVDAARFRVLGDGVLGLEPEYDPEIAGDLSARGHRLTALPRFDYGGAQVIMRTVDGLEGGSDRRKDGHVGTVD